MAQAPQLSITTGIQDICRSHKQQIKRLVDTRTQTLHFERMAPIPFVGQRIIALIEKRGEGYVCVTLNSNGKGSYWIYIEATDCWVRRKPTEVGPEIKALVIIAANSSTRHLSRVDIVPLRYPSWLATMRVYTGILTSFRAVIVGIATREENGIIVSGYCRMNNTEPIPVMILGLINMFWHYRNIYIIGDSVGHRRYDMDDVPSWR